MKEILILLAGLLSACAKLLGRGGARAVIAENLLLKQQLLIVCRHRRRAANLSHVGPENSCSLGKVVVMKSPGNRILWNSIWLRRTLQSAIRSVHVQRAMQTPLVIAGEVVR